MAKPQTRSWQFAAATGWRFFQRSRSDGFLSLVSWISLAGILLGVASLIVVMSVMNGFEAELRQRVLSVIPHGYINGPGERLPDWQEHAARVSAHPDVIAAAPMIGGSAMLLSADAVRGVVLRGVLPDAERRVSRVHEQVVAGAFVDQSAGNWGIVIGEILARQLRVGLGSEIRVLLPRATVTPFGIFPREKRFYVQGLFRAGTQLDGTTAFIHLNDAARLYQAGNTVSGLRLEFKDLFRADALLQELLPGFPDGSEPVSWSRSQGSLFAAVKMEKLMVRLMLMFIVLIAAFNIVSILTMAVSDKRPSVAVLRSMGATPATIAGVFVTYGMATGVLGVAGGIVTGIPLALYAGDVMAAVESLFGSRVFSPDVYFISYLPSVLELSDVVGISLIALLLSLLATLYPSLQAARISPAEALRYE